MCLVLGLWIKREKVWEMKGELSSLVLIPNDDKHKDAYKLNKTDAAAALAEAQDMRARGLAREARVAVRRCRLTPPSG